MQIRYVLVLLTIGMAAGCAGKHRQATVIGPMVCNGSCGSSCDGSHSNAVGLVEGQWESVYGRGLLRRPFRQARIRRQNADMVASATADGQTDRRQNSVPFAGQTADSWVEPVYENAVDTFQGASGFDDMSPPAPDQETTSRRMVPVPAAPKMRNRLENAIDEDGGQQVAGQVPSSRVAINREDRDGSVPRQQSPEKIAGSIKEVTRGSDPSLDELDRVGTAEVHESTRRLAIQESETDSIPSPAESVSRSAFDPQFETFRLEDLFSIDSQTDVDAVSESGANVDLESNADAELRVERQGRQATIQDTENAVRLPLNSISGRPERDLIRELQLSSQQTPNALRNSGKNASTGEDVMLTARPVPHYQELRQFAADGRQPIRLQTPVDFADESGSSSGSFHRESIRANPVSSREKIELGADFDFRPLPELLIDETIDITAPRMDEFLNEIFDSSGFLPAAENPTFHSLPPRSFRMNGTGETGDFTRLPTHRRQSDGQSNMRNVILRAIPRVRDPETGKTRVRRFEERSEARFFQPSFSRQVSEEPIADPQQQ